MPLGFKYSLLILPTKNACFTNKHMDGVPRVSHWVTGLIQLVLAHMYGVRSTTYVLTPYEAS